MGESFQNTFKMKYLGLVRELMAVNRNGHIFTENNIFVTGHQNTKFAKTSPAKLFSYAVAVS